MKHPKPWESFTTSGDDHGIIRTFDGHIGTNVNDDPDLASDIGYRKNTQWGDDADMGEYYDRDV